MEGLAVDCRKELPLVVEGRCPMAARSELKPKVRNTAKAKAPTSDGFIVLGLVVRKRSPPADCINNTSGTAVFRDMQY